MHQRRAHTHVNKLSGFARKKKLATVSAKRAAPQMRSGGARKHRAVRHGWKKLQRFEKLEEFAGHHEQLLPKGIRARGGGKSQRTRLRRRKGARVSPTDRRGQLRSSNFSPVHLRPANQNSDERTFSLNWSIRDSIHIYTDLYMSLHEHEYSWT